MRVEIYRDASKYWRWRLLAKNNEIVAASSESFITKWGANRNLFKTIKGFTSYEKSSF